MAEVIHNLVRSMNKTNMENITKWFAAQSDKGRLKMDFDFGTGNFVVSQWSRHEMYSGVEFETDVDGGPVVPALVAPPFTEVSLMDGLALMVSFPPKEACESNEDEAPSTSGVPRAIDAIFSVSEMVWKLLIEEETFRKFGC